jgi:hypothetical protein
MRQAASANPLSLGAYRFAPLGPVLDLPPFGHWDLFRISCFESRISAAPAALCFEFLSVGVNP